jgi:hypothetical protein
MILHFFFYLFEDQFCDISRIPVYLFFSIELFVRLALYEIIFDRRKIICLYLIEKYIFHSNFALQLQIFIMQRRFKFWSLITGEGRDTAHYTNSFCYLRSNLTMDNRRNLLYRSQCRSIFDTLH